MEYFVYLPDVGMQVFLCFQDDEEVEDHVWFEDRWMVASWCDK
jgi:hypothetical protein